MNSRKGFTLIEMLVVVAIIGILSASVLVALGPSRNKAKDARIISGVQQVRALAEALYDPTSATPYSRVIVGETNIAKVKTDVDSQAPGGALTISPVPPGTAYVVYARLASDPTKYYCADSAGTVVTGAAPGGGATVCPAIP